jgi:hypothetical protein
MYWNFEMSVTWQLSEFLVANKCQVSEIYSTQLRDFIDNNIEINGFVLEFLISFWRDINVIFIT